MYTLMLWVEPCNDREPARRTSSLNSHFFVSSSPRDRFVQGSTLKDLEVLFILTQHKRTHFISCFFCAVIKYPVKSNLRDRLCLGL